MVIPFPRTNIRKKPLVTPRNLRLFPKNHGLFPENCTWRARNLEENQDFHRPLTQIEMQDIGNAVNDLLGSLKRV